MHPAFISVMASAGVLVILGVLFQVEYSRGARFFPHIRGWFDRGIERIYAVGAYALHFLERDVLRQTFHYLLHQLLRLVLGVIRFLEHRLDWLLRRNRAIARRTSSARSMTQSKLSEIASHKQAAALSDEEKRAHKERSIGTKL